MTHSKTFSARIKALQNRLQSSIGDVYFIHNPVDLAYLTGIQMSLGHLFIGRSKACLFVDGRYFAAVKETSPVPVEMLKPQNEIDFLQGSEHLAFDGSTLSFEETTRLRSLCRKAKVKTSSHPEVLKKMRLIKDEAEISAMKRSADFAYQAYEWLVQRAKPGMSEKELANELKMHCLKHGVDKLSFEPIIAFGKNSALPHHRPTHTRLEENDILLFDLGIILDDYCSDMTRVHFIGKKDPKLLHLFEVNKAAQKAALAKCRPGTLLKELDQAARQVMREAGLEELFIHSLGHGIGREVHEYPRINSDGPDRNLKLEAGMAITIEPGLYLPGKGGVRYEDTVVITPQGYLNLQPE